MKNLMIALAAVAVAAVTQAASIDWSITANTWTYGDGNKAAIGTKVYLINAANYAALETAILGGATSFTTDTAGVLAVGTTANGKGTITTSTATSASLTAGTEYNFAYLVIDTRDASDVQYFASTTLSAKAYDPMDATYSEAQSIAFSGSNYSTSGLSGGWQSVPEPTSGLLLVLGMAGLALRRKRA